MRYLPTNKLTSGMAIGQDIFDGEGTVVFERHRILNQQAIMELSRLGYPGIYIDDEFTQGIVIQEVISPEIRRESLKAVHDVFMTGNEAGSIEEQMFHKSIDSVVDELLSNGDVMVNMIDIKSYADYIYFHSINVAMISAMIGCRMGLSKEQLKELTAGAMLHDIGERFIDENLLKTQRVLTDEERATIAQHPKLGYEYLNRTYHFAPEITLCVLEHHEWYNGEGYPLRRSGEEIPLYGRIIKVADSYDAMVSNRPFHKQIQPNDAVEYIMAMIGVEFDPKIVNLFLDCIAVYPVGCEVVLSNGKHAIVMKNYRGFVLRPRLKIIGTAETLDLKEDPDAMNITIIQMVME